MENTTISKPKKCYPSKITPKNNSNTTTSSTTGASGSSINGSGNNNAKNLKLCLLGHCIFCLRKIKSITHSTRLVTATGGLTNETCEEAKVGPTFLSTFNLVWPYMAKKKNEDNGIDVSINNQKTSDCITFDMVMGAKRNKCSEPTTAPPKAGAIKFTRLPVLCQYCANLIQHVEDLMKAIWAQIDVLRQVITDTKKGGQHSSRGEHFERTLRNAKNLGTDVIEGTLKLLEGLGDCSSGNLIRETVSTNAVVDKEVSQPLSERATSSYIYTLQKKAQPHTKNVFLQDKSVRSVTELAAEDEEMEFKEEKEEPLFQENENDQHPAPEHAQSYSDSEKDTEADAASMSCDDDEEYEDKLEMPVNMENDANFPDDRDPLEDVSRNDKPISRRVSRIGRVTFTEAELYLLRPYKCKEEGCMKSFDFENMLTIHLTRSHPEKYAPYKCTCGRNFKSEALQRRHVTRSHIHKDKVIDKKWEAEKQACDMCGEKVHPQDILEHVRGHVGDYALKCSTCPWVFTNSKSLTAHHQRSIGGKCNRRKRDNTFEFKCNTCEFKSNHRLSLRGHIQRHHERAADQNFSCPVASCDKSFSVRQSVDFHLSEHCQKPITTQKCQHCSEIFSLEEMESHLRNAHKIEEIKKCKHCPLMFSAWPSLVTHMFVHRFNGLFCGICEDNVKYTRHSEFRDHCVKVHQMEFQRYTCEFCSKEFFRKDSLKTHIKLHHSESSAAKSTNKKRKRYPCDTCFGSVSFLTEAGLIRHKIQKHGADPFTCKTCGATFVEQMALSRHEKEHGGMKYEKEFKCRVEGCGKVFFNKKNLKNHTMTNHSERNHVCHQCEKTYASAASLKLHHEAVHLGLRPYQCEQCGESFGNSSVLKHHKLIHTEERPFSCSICGQRFRQKEVLKRHERGHAQKGSDFKPNGAMKHIRKRKAKN